MSWLSTVPAVVFKELLVEWRDPSRTSGLVVFSFALLLMVAFAMPGVHLLPDVAGGALWLGLLLASTRSLDQSMQVELENGSLEAMVRWPVHPLAVFYGKAIANAVVLCVVAGVLTPLVLVLYHPTIRGDAGLLALVLVLGSAALAAPGTLVAALSTQARGASVLLPMLLLPVVVPVVLAATQATTLVFEGDPMQQAPNWIRLLGVFVVAHWAVDGLLFLKVVDDG